MAQDYKVWQTGKWLKRDKEHWFDFIIDEVKEHWLVLKTTSGEQKDKYSYIFFDEIDESLVFNS